MVAGMLAITLIAAVPAILPHENPPAAFKDP